MEWRKEGEIMLWMGRRHRDDDYWFEEAAKAARRSECRNARCGAVIVKRGKVIGRGFNGPPLGRESNRTCNSEYVRGRKPRFDITCCVHAEWRAVFDAVRRNPRRISGSRLYFMRVDAAGNRIGAGQPFCTVCSRLTMESGVAEFALWTPESPKIWPADEYDRISYSYFDPE